MDTTAFVATLTTALAIGLTIVLLRLLRQDRHRSEARVAALVMLAARPAAAAPSRVQPAAAMAFDQPPVRLERKPRPTTEPARSIAHERGTRARMNVASVDIFRETATAEESTAGVPELFGPATAPVRNNLLYVGAGAIALAGLIAISLGWAFSSGQVPADETSASIASPARAVPAPLALLALHHEQGADGTLVISGVVRNPADAAARQKLFAAASLLDANGGLVASARAPLDFTLLAPGEESPFVVRVSGAAGVARYRIGFRDAGGASVAHLDKR